MKKKTTVINTDQEKMMRVSIPTSIPTFNEFVEDLTELFAEHGMVFHSDTPVEQGEDPSDEETLKRVLH